MKEDCDRGKVSGCVLGGDAKVKEDDLPGVLLMATKACGFAPDVGCISVEAVGRAYEKKNDFESAAKIYKELCEHGNGAGCGSASALKVMQGDTSPFYYDAQEKRWYERDYNPQTNTATMKALSSKEVVSLTNDVIDVAKKTVCGLKIKPDSVTISLDPVSGSWETERLCAK